MTNFTRRTTLIMAASSVAIPLTATAQTTHEIQIANFKFQPAELTINAGDTVTWTNAGGPRHTATSLDGAFDTGLLGGGESGSITFNTAGTFEYRCTPHGNMRGSIIVS